MAFVEEGHQTVFATTFRVRGHYRTDVKMYYSHRDSITLVCLLLVISFLYDPLTLYSTLTALLNRDGYGYKNKLNEAFQRPSSLIALLETLRVDKFFPSRNTMKLDKLRTKYIYAPSLTFHYEHTHTEIH